MARTSEIHSQCDTNQFKTKLRALYYLLLGSLSSSSSSWEETDHRLFSQVTETIIHLGGIAFQRTNLVGKYPEHAVYFCLSPRSPTIPPLWHTRGYLHVNGLVNRLLLATYAQHWYFFGTIANMNRSSRNVLQTKTRMAPPLLRLNIHTNCGFSSFHTQCAIYIQSQHVVVSLIWWSLVFYYYYYFRENRQYVMGTRQQVRWEIVSVVRFHFHSLHWLDMPVPRIFITWGLITSRDDGEQLMFFWLLMDRTSTGREREVEILLEY